MNEIQMAKKIADLVQQQGGETYYVGGCVRDELLGLENKDIDIEIHHLSPMKLEKILDQLGGWQAFGRSFGVYHLKGYEIDIALPRKEQVIGKKHTDFQIDVDPEIGTYQAASRRDFTINALLKNVLTGEIVDHFGGLKDLQEKRIRHVNDQKFIEDPLRVLRAADFAARLGFTIDDETIHLCQGIDLGTLSKERVFEEMKKALLKAQQPSIFFECLRQMNGLDEWFGELKDLIGVKQDPQYHAEKDVYQHTLLVIDQASQYRQQVKRPLEFMLAAVVHDFGKVLTTTEGEDGHIHSYRHEIAGLPLVEKWLKRLTSDRSIVKYCLNMTKNHMRPLVLANQRSSLKATNKMFDEAIEPLDLIYLALADTKGRITSQPSENPLPFLLQRYERFESWMSQPYVKGQDLIDQGLIPDASFQDILAYAHRLRLANVNKASALKQTLNYAKKKKEFSR